MHKILSLDAVDRSSLFAKRLYQSRIFNVSDDGRVSLPDDLTHLSIRWTGMQHLELEDIATTALLVRQATELGAKVEFEWPRRATERFNEQVSVLSKLGFFRLWANDPSVDIGKNPHIQQGEERHGEHKYLPLRWYSIADFIREEQHSIWAMLPTIEPRAESEFREFLQQQGFADDPDTIDSITRVLFLEIGWNTVLHSTEQPEFGYGVLCGRVEKNDSSEPEFHLCLADLGVGIPYRLGSLYKASNRNFEGLLGCSTPSAILRYAFEGQASTRRFFPSAADKDSRRGLGLVATSLQTAGVLELRSGGGTLTLTGRGDTTIPQHHDGLVETPLPGVQATVRMRRRTRRVISRTGTPADVSLSQDTSIVLVRERRSAAQQGLEKAINRARSEGKRLIVDFGFNDQGIRDLDVVCKLAYGARPTVPLQIWNVSTDWPLFTDICRWLSMNLEPTDLPPLVVRNSDEAAYLGVRQLGANRSIDMAVSLSPHPSVSPYPMDCTPCHVSPDSYVQTAKAINNEFIEAGFTQKREDWGFFQGRIHLLSGETAPRFLSIAKNVENPNHLRRWTEIALAGIRRLLLTRRTPNGRLVLAGFASSVRPVLSQVSSRLGVSHHALALLTYDAPSKEELEDHVAQSDVVILLTDVLSTGTLTEAVAYALRQQRAELLGVVGLVDARREDERGKNLIELGFEQLALEAGSLLELRPLKGPKGRTNYWVDAVTFVPTQSAPTRSIDTRVASALELVMAADAIRSGHAVDGARHSSLVIDTTRLVEEMTSKVEAAAVSEITSRLQAREWKDFSPTIMLYPSGVSRIEILRKQDKPAEIVAAYKTGVTQYANLLSARWPNCERLEIPRAFDPAGRSRCAASLESAGYSDVEFAGDVIVLDDGLWSGRTVQQLIRLAVQAGAKRILVTPMIARLSPADLERVEAITSLQYRDSVAVVQVCYAIPLVIPVPYYSGADCPYELTIRRLRQWEEGSQTIAETARNLVTQLTGHRHGHPSHRTGAYAHTWLRLRAYVELAAESELAVEYLNRTIASLDTDIELEALFTLFLEEWQLLGRARLRQAVSPKLLSRAVGILMDRPQGNSAVAIAAASLLRSRYPDHFVRVLPTLTDRCLDDLDLLHRTVFHIATLIPRHRDRSEVQEFIRAVVKLGYSKIHRRDNREAVKLVAALQTLDFLGQQSEPAPESFGLRRAASELRGILRDPVLTHQTRPFLHTLTGMQTNLGDVRSETYRLFAEQWDSEDRPLLETKLLPVAAALQGPLLLASASEFGIPAAAVEYFAPLPNVKINRARDDLARITGGLRLLAAIPTLEAIAQSVSAAATRLHDHLVAPDSTIWRLIEDLQALSIGDITANLRTEIDKRFNLSGRGLTVTIREENPKLRVFASMGAVRPFIRAIADNLERHAFPPKTSLPEPPLVEVEVTQDTRADGEPVVYISVKNNGKPLPVGEPKIGLGTEQAITAVQRFGGHVGLPQPADRPWSVIQTLTLLLW
jgi:adenine/guanine phosphoribosyltransferase-like PRPP-binding protein